MSLAADAPLYHQRGRLLNPTLLGLTENLLNPVGDSPKCFILVRTSALSSCLSERLNRFSLCWLILSAALPGPPLAALDPRPPFLLSRRAHCMLFLLSSGWSEVWEEVETGSEEVELRWAPVRDRRGSLDSLVSS